MGIRRQPGVYIEELNLAARTIADAPTSTTAFIGRTRRGPVDRPTRVASVAEFERIYGKPWAGAPLTAAIRHYFANGGRDAIVSRVRNGGHPLTDADLSDPALEAQRRGLWALDRVPAFNVLVIPPLGPDRDVGRATWDAAAEYVRRRRAMVIVDPPASWQDPADVTPAALDAVISPGPARANAALYFPWLRAADAGQPAQLGTYAPGGAVAGVWARTDEARGVWTSPGGLEATLVGVESLSIALTDAQNDPLNRRGVNVLRAFPGREPVVWGARTLAGADELASEWKYVTVRRTALFLEESIDHGTRWAVFEPNGEPLWAELRRRVGTFMFDLFRRGAFQGRVAEEACFVKCDASTTTQNDIDNGLVTILVGFAPIKPAEFVIFRIQQRTNG